MRKRPLLWFACVFLSGLAFQRYESIWLIILPIYLIGIEIFYGVKHKKIWKNAGRSFLLLSAFYLGMTHMQKEELFRDAYMSKLSDDSTVIVWGEIIQKENTDYGVRMILSDCYISLNEDNIPCNDILVYASSTHFQVGEIHKITGQLNMFERARNQGNFDSLIFYQSQKIDFSIWCEQNQLLAKSSVLPAHALLYFKMCIKQVFATCMDTKTAGFFTGMILGDKTNLDEKLKDLFTMAGISHILAISGLHVSIIGRGLYQQLRKRGVGFGIAGIVSSIVLISYCFVVGNGMSAVRAVGMMLISFVGQYLGRGYDMLNALGAMVLYLLWDNPFLLEYSGFWFSVVALIGVGYVGKTLSEHVTEVKHNAKNRKITLFENIAQSMWMCMGITLSTLPIVAMCYYEVPLYSSLVNFIVLPVLTPIFCLALAAGVIGIWFPNFATIALIPCGWVLRFYEWFCQIINDLPFSSIVTGTPSMQIVVVYYLVLFAGVFFIERDKRKNTLDKSKTKTNFRVESIVVSVICFCLIIYPKEKPFEITFLDVGQGDGIYISAGDGTTYFIDGGSTSEESVGEYRMLPFLKSKDVSKIDYWFVSHADMDHISGLIEVLDNDYQIGHLVVSEYAPEDENLLMLVEQATNHGVKMIQIEAGERIVSTNVSFTCLYPWDSAQQDQNEASLVLEMETTDGRKAFFAGDISSEVEQLLLRKGVLDDVWLYKASHHGSKYSNSLELLENLQPEVSVISCSRKNLYGHPHEEVIERIEAVGSEILYTMENGQVAFKE